MKSIKYFIALIALFMIGALGVYAKSNPYPQYEDSPFGGKMINCTWYAWKAAKERMGVELPTWYNVWTWADKAKKAGFTVSMTPKENSLMILDYNKAFNTTGAGGHVAYVTKVEGDKVTYDEGGNAFGGDNGVATQTDTIKMLEAMGLQGFIYLDNAPKTTTTTKKATTTTKKTTTKSVTTTTTTTSIAPLISLKTLTIEGLDLEFNTSTYEYNLEANEDMESIKIEAVPFDSTLIVEGTGEFKLNPGENRFVVTVGTEGHEYTDYVINIKKEAKSTTTTQENKTTEKAEEKIEPKSTEDDRLKNYLIIGSGVIGAIIVLCLIIKIKR